MSKTGGGVQVRGWTCTTYRGRGSGYRVQIVQVYFEGVWVGDISYFIFLTLIIINLSSSKNSGWGIAVTAFLYLFSHIAYYYLTLVLLHLFNGASRSGTHNLFREAIIKTQVLSIYIIQYTLYTYRKSEVAVQLSKYRITN